MLALLIQSSLHTSLFCGFHLQNRTIEKSPVRFTNSSKMLKKCVARNDCHECMYLVLVTVSGLPRCHDMFWVTRPGHVHVQSLQCGDSVKLRRGHYEWTAIYSEVRWFTMHCQSMYCTLYSTCKEIYDGQNTVNSKWRWKTQKSDLITSHFNDNNIPYADFRILVDTPIDRGRLLSIFIKNSQEANYNDWNNKMFTAVQSTC